MVCSHLQKRITCLFTPQKRQLHKKIPEKIVTEKLISIQRDRQRYVVSHLPVMQYLTRTHCQKMWYATVENKATLINAEVVSEMPRGFGKGTAIMRSKVHDLLTLQPHGFLRHPLNILCILAVIGRI